MGEPEDVLDESESVWLVVQYLNYCIDESSDYEVIGVFRSEKAALARAALEESRQRDTRSVAVHGPLEVQ